MENDKEETRGGGSEKIKVHHPGLRGAKAQLTGLSSGEKKRGEWGVRTKGANGQKKTWFRGSNGENP